MARPPSITARPVIPAAVAPERVDLKDSIVPREGLSVVFNDSFVGSATRAPDLSTGLQTSETGVLESVLPQLPAEAKAALLALSIAEAAENESNPFLESERWKPVERLIPEIRSWLGEDVGDIPDTVFAKLIMQAYRYLPSFKSEWTEANLRLAFRSAAVAALSEPSSIKDAIGVVPILVSRVALSVGKINLGRGEDRVIEIVEREISARTTRPGARPSVYGHGTKDALISLRQVMIIVENAFFGVFKFFPVAPLTFPKTEGVEFRRESRPYHPDSKGNGKKE